ncbi:MAG: transmembrane anchor protein [Allosphingosinicella sp.]|uniref:transmembrane anchor protein n=1 Tax=Allosphingosinicella sp. TaxID=2823234 RepID=UPI00394F344A
MHNSNIPTHVELPSSRQLVRSTLVAVAVAGAMLVAVVLPAEYAIDPTGAGKALGLTEMGEIKMQLAQEAEADRAGEAQVGVPVVPAAAAPATQAAAEPAQSAGARSDEMAIMLSPGEGAEVKLSMVRGAKANFSWTVTGGVVNFDLHGDGGGRSARYEQGRGVPGAQGVLEAAFDGNHGWFWRNRGDAPVTVTVRTNGAYSDINRLI